VARLRPFRLKFPLGGLNRRTSLADMPQDSTPLCMNVWPIDPSTGRERGGVRPPMSTLASRGQAPYAWCPVRYLATGTVRTGIAATFADGTYTTLDGVTWTVRIATDPGTDFASCAIKDQKLFQAAAGAKTRQYTFATAVETTLQPDAGGGSDAPENCAIVWVHQDRLALAGDPNNSHVIYMSAAGDSANWDTSINAAGGAWTNTGAAGGYVGEQVTAAIRHTDNTSLIGSAYSMYSVTGNPRTNGARPVSEIIGPLSHKAWCKGTDAEGSNATFLFTGDGLLVIPEGATRPQRLSREKLPNELVGVSPGAGDKVTIGYDQRWMGIHVSVDYNSGTDVDYFFDLQSGGWWPEDFTDLTPHLYATFPAIMSSTKSSILGIGSSGAVKQFNTAGSEDFDSYLVFPPIIMGDVLYEGVMKSINAVLADGSQSVNWELYVGKSVEAAYQKIGTPPSFADKDPSYSGTAWNREGINFWQNPQVAGYAAFLKIYDVSNERWLIEEIFGELAPSGRRRQ
jgi:hypothetical protein